MTLYEQWQNLINSQTDETIEAFGRNTVLPKQESIVIF